jgi:hypothetical protein
MITVASSVRIFYVLRSMSAKFITSGYSTTNPPWIVRGRHVSWNCLLYLKVRMVPFIKLHSNYDANLSWYKRSEMGSRLAIFFSSVTIAGAFSTCLVSHGLDSARTSTPFEGGLLAAAIANMDGVGGKPGNLSTIVSSAIPEVIVQVGHGSSFLRDWPRSLLLLSRIG